MTTIRKTLFAFASILIFLSGMQSTYAVGGNPTPGFNHQIPEHIMTPDTVETRIGELNFYDGIPTDETIATVYDNLDFYRGIEVFLNFIPATSIEGVRLGMKELGADDYNEVIVFDDLMDSAPLFLTGNTWTEVTIAMSDSDIVSMRMKCKTLPASIRNT